MSLFMDITKCPICGKQFIPTPEWAYCRRIDATSKTFMRFCSYKCMREFDSDVSGYRQKILSNRIRLTNRRRKQ